MVRFAPETLNERVDAWVHVIVTGVPGFSYDNEYDVEIEFDLNSLTLVEKGETPPPAKDGGNKDNTKTDPPTKDLSYERDNGNTNNGEGNEPGENRVQNAQTLDTNLISLYVALFVASGAYLIWRRRRVRLVD